MMADIEAWRKQHCPGWIGNDSQVVELFRLVKRFSETRDPILLTGETGTGKELIAQAIHSGSEVKGPFVAVNCAAVNPDTLFSELFGHEKGAFTSAVYGHAGFAEHAAKGTLFLDEVADLPYAMQGVLLRLLESQVFRRVGSTDELHFRGRVVAATNKDLGEEIDKGTFRSDLFFRLDVLGLSIPPLRERKQDILQMIRAFAAPRSFTPSAEALLKGYNWPGNVRELQHTIKRALASTHREVLDRRDLIFRFRTKLTKINRYHIAEDDHADRPICELSTEGQSGI